MSHYFIDDECNDCMNDITIVSNTNAWSCILCGMTEIEMVLDGVKMVWHRYKLKDGKEAHERCYRRHCKAQ